MENAGTPQEMRNGDGRQCGLRGNRRVVGFKKRTSRKSLSFQLIDDILKTLFESHDRHDNDIFFH